MRVWFLTHRLPYAPNRGDRIRAYHILRLLSGRADVEVFSLVHDDLEAAHVDDLRSLTSHVAVARVPTWTNRARGALRLASEEPLTFSLLRAPALLRAIEERLQTCAPDVVLAYCSSMARIALDSPLRDCPLVVDMVDVDSEKWRALAARVRGVRHLIYQREARCLRTFEGHLLDRAVTTIAINDREVDELRAIRPSAPITRALNGIDMDFFRPDRPPVDRPEVTFCGVLDYEPNETAALRLVQKIWPMVLMNRRDATLSLVGANPTPALRQSVASAQNVSITGAVPDVRPYLWASAVSVAPLETARGVQNKVLEALAAGLPVVVSPVVAAGLPTEVKPGVLTAGSDQEFARMIVELLEKGGQSRRALAGRADLASLTWERQLEPMWEALLTAAQPPGLYRQEL